jgi:PadR family transcriptional regulator PadR
VIVVVTVGDGSAEVPPVNVLDNSTVARLYVVSQYMEAFAMLDKEVKRGSTEMLILALVEDRSRHGYEIAKLIEQRSDGVLQFHVASLYPLLYRMEKRGLIKGTWIEKTGQRRRRFYKLMPEGKKVLNEQRQTWSDFFTALDRVAKINPA